MEKITFSKIHEAVSSISVKEISKGMLESFYKVIGRSIKKDDLEEKSILTKDVENKEIITSIESKDIFPEKVGDINSTEYLGGSSGVRAGYANGEYFVIKKARELPEVGIEGERLNKEQLVDEYIADRIYEVMGFNVPVSKIYEEGEYKVSKFIKGKNLDTFSSEEPEFENIKKEIQRGFALDCLLANWDVLGTSGESGGDNIRIREDGKVYRIDNGGALRFRARGEKKGDSFGMIIDELSSLKLKNKLFSDISDEQIEIEVSEILKNEDKIMKVIEDVKNELNLESEKTDELKLIIRNRFNYLKIFRGEKKEKIKKSDKGNYESITTNNYFDDWDEVELVGNSGIKEKIKENIIFAEERNKNEYEDAAKDLGISVEEFKEKLQKKIEGLIEKSNFFRATRVDILDKVLNVDGRYKSQFETGTSQGSLDPTSRADAEKLMFEFDYDEKDVEKNKEMRPIYGYFSDEINGAINYKGKIPPPNNVSYYGCINVKIKKEKALQKATITFKDSLGDKNCWPPTPAKKPHFSSFRMSYTGSHILEDFKATSVTNYGSSYNEAQYHGQLTMDDVESIHISSGNGLSSEDIEMIHDTFKKYKEMHPESTIELIEF